MGTLYPVEKPTVLITGAAGRIGTCLHEGLRHEFRLRGFDRREPAAAFSGGFFQGELTDYDGLKQAMDGAQAVVHLAATPGDAPFIEDLTPNNIIGVRNAFEAAREAGVRRVVYASTCQVVTGGYPHEQTVTTLDPPRPLSVYGATKAFGETLGRWYHDKHGLEVVTIRIGWFLAYDDPLLRENRDARHLWLSPRDAVGLFRCAMQKEAVSYAVVFGTSQTEREWLSRRETRELLGYEPEDRVP